VTAYDGLDAYARSKLANVLFAFELADRLDGPTATCCHPGFVPGSGLWRNASLPVRAVVGVLGALPDPVTRLVAETPATAAATQTRLAAAPEAADWNGEYVSDCEPTDPAPQARDPERRERLWELSVDLSDLDDDAVVPRERSR
jgi:NAD(P)-dependent dehydrogenase (short-subunit alcohol dehydrogenase family)